MTSSAFERGQTRQMRLHVLPTDRFKTYAITVNVGMKLDERTVTPVALIPFVLRRGTSDYPETKQFRRRLDDLYGAGFGFDIVKRGDYQIVQFRMDIVNDRYVPAPSSSLLRQAMAFLGGVITSPVMENGAFREKYAEAEKNTLRKRQEAVINDKIRYAAERCVAEMCAGEPYRLSPLGTAEALAEYDAASLYGEYERWLRDAPIDIYVVGQTSLQEVKECVDDYFRIDRPASPDYKPSLARASAGPLKQVTERMDVTQGKLNMGLRTGATYRDDEYVAALMYNGILGAFPHSKLFLNVREKASLAYYASSRLDGHKGILTIQSGIEFANYEQAVEIIRRQLEDMSAGRISELEMAQTRSMIGNQLREIRDSAFEMTGFDFNTVLSGRERTGRELLEQLEQVKISDIQQVAENVELDTIYFLRDEKGE